MFLVQEFRLELDCSDPEKYDNLELTLLCARTEKLQKLVRSGDTRLKCNTSLQFGLLLQRLLGADESPYLSGAAGACDFEC